MGEALIGIVPRALRSFYSGHPLLDQDEIAAQRTQLCLDRFPETGIADDCVDL